MCSRSALVVVAIALAFVGAAPQTTGVPPSADTDVMLADGRTLHLRALPLGQMDGVVRDGAQFDTSGSRVAFLATFPGGSIDGDWRTANPTQAYVADLSRRTLVALTADGLASAVLWRDATHLTVSDGGSAHTVNVLPPLSSETQHARMVSSTAEPTGNLVSPAEVFRLEVFKSADGSYAVGQVGAVRLRTEGIARDGAVELIGSFIAWIDGSRHGGKPFARAGSDEVMPPAFTGSAYGDSLTPVLPLGHAVYQGAYRNGVAFFAFSYGITRIVAATRDFVNYSYPALPPQPAFTVGDGLGAGADGVLYFARPEDGLLQFWKNGAYVRRTMSFPDDSRDTRRLYAAMERVAGGGLIPPMQPDANALDAAMLEWRMYPVGDATGDKWAASFLGRTYVAASNLKFAEISGPSFPFALLGRTDDGRLWGASRATATSSRLWWSRDGMRWSFATAVDGFPGAAGMRGDEPWIAMTKIDAEGPEIAVAPIGRATVTSGMLTGAFYAGEDMFFASISGGFYLVCGAAPGTRVDLAERPLEALRVEQGVLRADVYARERRDPSTDESFPPTRFDQTVSGILNASTSRLAAVQPSRLATLITNVQPSSTSSIRVMTFDQERAYQIKYATRPYPLAEVRFSVVGDTAVLRRSYWQGPLSGEGDVERWTRGASGDWRLEAIVSRWRL